MTALTEYISKKENLYPLSAYITATVLVVVFILAHILGYTPFQQEDQQDKMEIQELVKLKFTPSTNTPKRDLSSKVSTNAAKAKIDKVERPQRRPVQQNVNVAALMQGIQLEKLILNQSKSNHKRAARHSQPSTAINTRLESSSTGITQSSLTNDLSKHSSSFSTGRKSGSIGSSQGAGVDVGGGSGSYGVVSGVNGKAISGRASSRTSRVSGSGSGGATISLPTGTGDGDGALDLHALIKWMKEHPGAIPRLVQHEMGHQNGDLSSAVMFTMNNRKFRLFLSCNEVEMLLRICLVEEGTFTLLKDNGIREQSNFLTEGDVVYSRGQIQSLISSRRAPQNKAAAFYNIFWSWWLQQSK